MATMMRTVQPMTAMLSLKTPQKIAVTAIKKADMEKKRIRKAKMAKYAKKAKRKGTPPKVGKISGRVMTSMPIPQPVTEKGITYETPVVTEAASTIGDKMPIGMIAAGVGGLGLIALIVMKMKKKK